MTAIYSVNAKKRPANISINAELLQKAKEYKINISSCVEATLTELVKQKESQNWIAQNKEALQHYNEYINQNGLFSDSLRSF